MEKVRVLSHYGGADALGIPADLRGRVEVIEVAQDGPLPDDAAGEVLVSRRRATNINDAAERVKWIHVVGTGVDNLDIARLSRLAVVTNSRGAAGVPIAEWVLATLLAYEKQLPESWMGSPRDWDTKPSIGTLVGKELALIGLGSIGTEVATRALAFGMQVRALRRSAASSPVDGVAVVRSVGELLAGADYLVLACALTPETRHIVDVAALQLVKPGIHIVNPARGELIDDDALHAALDDGRVARASLDATWPEPLPARHWMYRHPAVRLTGHVSWMYPGARAALTDVFVENLRRFLDGAPLQNVLDPERSY